MRRVASTDGIELGVHDFGGHGVDLLLAHATGFHGLVWRPLVAALRDDPDAPAVHAWAVDLRGHGASPAPADHAFAWSGFADDVLAVVEGLGLHRPLGVGHSKGAAALLLAEQRRPGTFRGLYCYEPVVVPEAARRASGSNALAAGARRRRETFASRQEAYDNFAAKPPLDALHPDALAAYVEHGLRPDAGGRLRLACPPEHEARVYEMAGTAGAWTGLAGITCPVVVASGPPDEGPGGWAASIAAAIPGARHHRFDALGHFGPLQDPAAVAADVAALLRDAGPDPVREP